MDENMIEKTPLNALCLGWCDADDVINYGQILQGCAMMYIVRHLVSGKITFISFFPRTKKGKLRYWFKHYNIFSGHLISYLKTRKKIEFFIRHNNIHFIKADDDKKLDELSQDVDIMICGSDQIWHPQNYDKTFFLGFGDKSIKRISYASSIPKTKIEPQFKKQIHAMKNYLKQIDDISIRESLSIPFVQELCNKTIHSVFDPTFLVPRSVWNGLVEKKSVEDNYILVYVPNGIDKKMVKIIDRIKARRPGSVVYSIVTRGEKHAIESKELSFVSLGQFLYLIKNASCVITSSFHAVVFCSCFHKEFWCYNCTNPERGEDVRLASLLQDLGIPERLIDTEGEISDNPIDYKAVDQQISIKSEKSKAFLRGALNID